MSNVRFGPNDIHSHAAPASRARTPATRRLTRRRGIVGKCRIKVEMANKLVACWQNALTKFVDTRSYPCKL